MQEISVKVMPQLSVEPLLIDVAGTVTLEPARLTVRLWQTAVGAWPSFTVTVKEQLAEAARQAASGLQEGAV